MGKVLCSLGLGALPESRRQGAGGGRSPLRLPRSSWEVNKEANQPWNFGQSYFKKKGGGGEQEFPCDPSESPVPDLSLSG